MGFQLVWSEYQKNDHQGKKPQNKTKTLLCFGHLKTEKRKALLHQLKVSRFKCLCQRASEMIASESQCYLPAPGPVSKVLLFASLWLTTKLKVSQKPLCALSCSNEQAPLCSPPCAFGWLDTALSKLPPRSGAKLLLPPITSLNLTITATGLRNSQ